VEFITFVIAYAIAVLVVHSLREHLPVWQRDTSTALGLSAAGLWHGFVSLPLLLTLLLGWVWRLLLWWRFLLVMSNLDLRMIATHPDQCGGLQFLSTSIRGFRLLALALAAVVAGGQIQLVLRTGKPFPDYKNGAIAVVVVIVLLAVGPLMVFMRKIRSTKASGIFRYGTLGRDVGAEFEQKWLDQVSKPDLSVLQAEDFSAMTDLNSVVENVYNMKDMPFSVKHLQNIIVAALIPFIPVALMTMPLKEILLALAKLVV
jgi:hypothetical protein